MKPVRLLHSSCLVKCHTQRIRSPATVTAFIMVYTLVVHMRAKSDKAIIEKLKNKLIEASQVYSKDKETVSWLVMQSVFDSREFTIVERYERESSQQYHLSNPYWKVSDEWHE